MQTLLGLDAATYEPYSSSSSSSFFMRTLPPLEAATSASTIALSQSGSASAQQHRQRIGPRRPCLRCMSAYSGGFKDDSYPLTDAYSSNNNRRVKTLTFADQHGRQLVRLYRCFGHYD